MKNKLCLYFNMPSKYREEIYERIDKEYDCSWYFDKDNKDIKLFNSTILRSYNELETKHFRGFYWTKGLLNLLCKGYSHYIMIGATRNLSLYVFLLLKYLFFRNKKVVFWTHGYYGKENWVELNIFKRPLLKMADRVMLYGNYARDLMINDGFDSNKLVTIHNSLAYTKQKALRDTIQNTSIYSNHFSNSNPVLIFLGRLTPVKKLDMILVAMNELKQMGEEYNMVFVGDGTERLQLEKCVKDLGLDLQVWFFGACYDEAKNAELIYNADLCIAPGNVGLTAMHSMMFGCPVITHNDFKKQMPEFESVIPGKTGAFFERDNISSLAKQISMWFKQNTNNREEVRKSCYAEIDESWNPDFQLNVIDKVLS